MVFIPITEAQTLYNLRDQETEVVISLEDVGGEDEFISDLQGQLPGYEVDSWRTLRPEIQETMAIKSTFTSIFGFIVLLIASIGILNLMLMAVFERTREMGVLAALGWKGRQIMGLFLLEGMFIGAIGGLVGCALGWLISLYFAQVGIDFAFASEVGGEITALMGTRIYTYITFADILGYFISVVIIAALASLWPAWQASRSEPAEALHHV
jgi:ABC-type lipoprotein release transport system permease subunit